MLMHNSDIPIAPFFPQSCHVIDGDWETELIVYVLLKRKNFAEKICLILCALMNIVLICIFVKRKARYASR